MIEVHHERSCKTNVGRSMYVDSLPTPLQAHSGCCYKRVSWVAWREEVPSPAQVHVAQSIVGMKTESIDWSQCQ